MNHEQFFLRMLPIIKNESQNNTLIPWMQQTIPVAATIKFSGIKAKKL